MAWDNIISRSIWVIIQPSNLMVLLLITAFITNNVFAKKERVKNISRKAIICSLIMLSAASFTNISSWLLWPLEGRFASYNNLISSPPYSGIIVLGGSELTTISTAVDQATLRNSGERLIEAAALARKLPDLPIIHNGGSRQEQDEWSENDVAERFFKDAGTDISRIRFDRKSYNTHSNATESRKMISEYENEKWLLVTSAFHMPRSVGAFRKAGVNIQPYPVDYMTTMNYQGIFNFDAAKNLRLFDWAIHEYIGLFAYYVTGRSSSLFPAIES